MSCYNMEYILILYAKKKKKSNSHRKLWKKTFSPAALLDPVSDYIVFANIYREMVVKSSFFLLPLVTVK